MLVHPDKNPTMTDRASLAFEGRHRSLLDLIHSFFYLAINKAYKLLEDEKERKKCLEVIEEARERVEKMVSSSSNNKSYSFISHPLSGILSIHFTLKQKYRLDLFLSLKKFKKSPQH